MAATRIYRRMSELLDVTGSPGTGTSPVSDGQAAFPLTSVATTDDVNTILAGVAAVNWRPLGLQPDFTPYGDQFIDPRYRLTLNNVVHVEGMVRSVPPLSDDDVGKLIATLDQDCLPGGALLFSCPAWGNTARFDVEADGSITFQGMLMGGGMIDWFSLSSITFSVGAAQ